MEAQPKKEIRGIDLHRIRSIYAIASVILVGSLATTSALPMLRLSDGLTQITVADNGIGDENPALGAVTFAGAVGDSFFLNVSTGISDPILGSPALPHMDLNSVDISGGGGVLTISFTDDDFGPTSNAEFLARIGGTTEGFVTYKTYLSTSNELFGGVELTSLSNLGSGAFSASGSAFPGELNSQYALTLEVKIDHAPGVLVTGFDAELLTIPLAVPDGGATCLLLGFGLLGLGRLKLRK